MPQPVRMRHLLLRALRWVTKPWGVPIDLPPPDPHAVWPGRPGNHREGT